MKKQFLQDMHTEGYNNLVIGNQEWIFTHVPLGIANFVISVAAPVSEVLSGFISGFQFDSLLSCKCNF